MERLVKVVAIIRVLYIVYLAFEAYNMTKSRRRWWVRPVNLTREELGFFASCTSQLKDKDEEHFFKATRMSVAKFQFLLSLIKGRLERFSIRKPIQPEVRLTLTLLYLSQGCCPQFLAWSHKIGISTARKIIYETCQALWEELHDIYISPPSTAEWAEIADIYYSKTGMPHCLGAIDGKLVDIVRPKCSGSLYYTYKKTFSIILLAACDSNYRFTFVDVGALGSQSHGGVFSKSAFGKKILQENLNVPLDQNLPDTIIQFPFYFVGDNAFPLRKNLMRPYPGRLLSPEKNAYNKKLSKALNRWRVLYNRINASPKNADKIVLATVVLHNFLMMSKDDSYFNPGLVDHEENGVLIPGGWREDRAQLQSARITPANRGSRTAFEIRDILKTYLNNN